MEFPNTGFQCTKENCKQLNFLPHFCACGLPFCEEHFMEHSLLCQITDNRVTELKVFDSCYVCSEKGCKNRSIVPLLCGVCNKHFCLKHRHIGDCVPKTEEDYAKEREKLAAPSNHFNAIKKIVDQEVSKNLEDAKKSGKNRKMAHKIELMRLKTKATGMKTIPTADRLYLHIFHSKLEKAIFVSKVWTVGRAIDAIAETCNLQNNNNKSGELKLRLFKMDNTALTKVTSDCLNDLLQNGDIIDGEKLYLEYVKDDCFVLS